MARRPKAPKEKKRKKVSVKLANRKNAGQITMPYSIMDDLVEKYHTDLLKCDANIAIAWLLQPKPDADGRVKCGTTKKGSDLDHQLHHHDFVICLNKELWDASTREQQVAMMDHRLCYCAVSMDSNGEPKIDEDGRTVFRLRKPEIVEFREVVSRHGMYTSDLEHFVERAVAAKKTSRPLLDELEKNGDGDASAEEGKSKAKARKAK